LSIGYIEKGRTYYLLSPEPPKIHAFVTPIAHEQCQQFFSNTQYLHVLFGLSSQIFNLDELLLALLNNLKAKNLLTEPKVTSFIENFSLLTGNDYRRLKLFLQRAQPLISHM
jgi:hypothetical protein